MHFLVVLVHSDSQTLLATATNLKSVLAKYTVHLYTYDNLSSDPDPGGWVCPQPILQQLKLPQLCVRACLCVCARACVCACTGFHVAASLLRSWTVPIHCHLLHIPMAPYPTSHAMLHDTSNTSMSLVRQYRVLITCSRWPAESSLAIKVGGDLQYPKYLKNLVDPNNVFTNHQMQGLKPLITTCLAVRLLLMFDVGYLPAHATCGSTWELSC